MNFLKWSDSMAISISGGGFLVFSPISSIWQSFQSLVLTLSFKAENAPEGHTFPVGGLRRIGKWDGILLQEPSNIRKRIHLAGIMLSRTPIVPENYLKNQHSARSMLDCESFYRCLFRITIGRSDAIHWVIRSSQCFNA